MWISWERVCRLVDVVLNSMYSVYTIYIYLCAVRYRSKILALVRVFFFCCLAFCVNDCSEKLSTLLLLLVLCPFGWCCLIFKWFFMFVSMRLSLSFSLLVFITKTKQYLLYDTLAIDFGWVAYAKCVLLRLLRTYTLYISYCMELSSVNDDKDTRHQNLVTNDIRCESCS